MLQIVHPLFPAALLMYHIPRADGGSYQLFASLILSHCSPTADMDEMNDLNRSGGWRWSNGAALSYVMYIGTINVYSTFWPPATTVAAAAGLSSPTFQQHFWGTCL